MTVDAPGLGHGTSGASPGTYSGCLGSPRPVVPRQTGRSSSGATARDRSCSRPPAPHAAIVLGAVAVRSRIATSFAGPIGSATARRAFGSVCRCANRFTITSPVRPAARLRAMHRSSVGRRRRSVSPVTGLRSTHTSVVVRSSAPHQRPNTYRYVMSGEYRLRSGSPPDDRPFRLSRPYCAASTAKTSRIRQTLGGGNGPCATPVSYLMSLVVLGPSKTGLAVVRR
jgi:hypothetical protein